MPQTRLPVPVLAASLLCALAAGTAQAQGLPPGAGLAVVKKECTRCHALNQITNSDGKTRTEWQTHVIRMTDIERRPANLQAVLDYLSAHFPR